MPNAVQTTNKPTNNKKPTISKGDFKQRINAIYKTHQEINKRHQPFRYQWLKTTQSEEN